MSFTSLLKQTVQIYAAGGTNKYGRVQEGSATDHKARVDLRTTTRRGTNGELITMAGKVFLLPDVTVAQGTRIDWNGHSYQVEQTYEVPGGNGSIHHIEADIVEFRG